jgi:6,7-dimethyl-8-ribityllumazine synthase
MAQVSDSNLFEINTGILKKNARVVIVRTEWNNAIVGELEAGCVRELKKHGVKNIEVLIVPGAFEIPFAIKQDFDRNKKKARASVYIALGCVLRGDTPHFDYVCKAVTDGVLQLNLLLSVPTIFGVLTVDNQQQAEERIGGKHGHKGEEAAVTALKMLIIQRNKLQ